MEMAALELETRLHRLLSNAHTETANIDLFAPIPEREECPICMIPLPYNQGETVFNTCCGKRVCKGCILKKMFNDEIDGTPQHEQKCAFCRRVIQSNNTIKQLKKLMKNNHPDAFIMMAEHYKTGDLVFQSDTKALEMYTRAAELGHFDAYLKIGEYYYEGIAVNQNTSKALDFLEVAAKKGSLYAHTRLAGFYGMSINWNKHKLIKHTTVAANAGCKTAMDALMKFYREKMLSKEELTQTLHAFQAASNEMKNGVVKVLEDEPNSILKDGLRANVTAIGDVTLTRNYDTSAPECGGSLAGESFLGGTDGKTSVKDATGVVTSVHVEVRKKCTSSKDVEAFDNLIGMIRGIFVDYFNGSFTDELQSWSRLRIPQIPQLFDAEVLADTFVVIGSMNPYAAKVDAKFYPVWSGINRCKNDGLQDDWMLADESTYIFDNIEDCCQRHFATNFDDCISQ